MNQQIFEKVKTSIADSLNVKEDEVTLDITLADLNADSLDAVEAIMNLEKVFNIAIPDDHMEKFTNIHSIVDYIEANTPKE